MHGSPEMFYSHDVMYTHVYCDKAYKIDIEKLLENLNTYLIVLWTDNAHTNRQLPR